MREIKFRAWLKEEQVMLSVYVLDQTVRASTGEHFPTSRGSDYLGHTVSFNIDDAILMQFTGLMASNGDAIFEGDILEYTLIEMGGGEVTYREEVKFVNGCFDLDNCPVSIGNSTGEVKGNIYQHPELLK